MIDNGSVTLHRTIQSHVAPITGVSYFGIFEDYDGHFNCFNCGRTGLE
jgi:hypothetical protein